jgi:hypothetical protein
MAIQCQGYFWRMLEGKRPKSTLFALCFRLSLRTGMRQSICP